MPSVEERIDNLIIKVDNQRCADCFDKQPANVTILVGGLEKALGAFICFRCARVHEKFGNDMGYVLNARNENDCKQKRCADRNKLWLNIIITSIHANSMICLFLVSFKFSFFASPRIGSEEEVQALERGGNKIVNAIFESKIAYDHPRPDVNSPPDVRQRFSADKYIERLFFSESKAAKLMKAPPKQSSGRFTLKGPKDSGSGRGFNSSDSSGDFSFDSDDGGLGYGDAAPDVATGVAELSLDAAPAAPPPAARQRRTRRRASIGGNDPAAPKGPPSRAMSLQVEGAVNPNVRRTRPGRRSSLGRTASMGAPAAAGPPASGAEPRIRRAGRRGSVGGAGGSSNNLSVQSGGASQRRERRPGRRGSVGGKGGSGGLDSNSNHSLDWGAEEGGDGKSGNSRHRRRLGKGAGEEDVNPSQRRRPQRRGSIGVEDANAKLNKKREMVW
ncbi:MAG: hypothetical protein SGBAC_012464 [Bacillariaceae sp.]